MPSIQLIFFCLSKAFLLELLHELEVPPVFSLLLLLFFSNDKDGVSRR